MSKKHKFVITNPNLCVGCGACAKTCQKESIKRGKLGVSRLWVVKFDKTATPNQCRQCDDAPCAVVCPSGALENKDDFVHLNENLCIGCSLCVLACPYGAIHLDCESVFGVQKMPNELSQPGFASIATKCDICEGRDDGSACVEVCPKGAIIMLDFANTHKIGKKLKDTKNMQDFVFEISGENIDLSEFGAQNKPNLANNLEQKSENSDV